MSRAAGYPLLRLGLLLGACLALSLVPSLAFLAGAVVLLAGLAILLGLPRGLPKVLAAGVLAGLPWLYLLFSLAGREATGSWRQAFVWGFWSLAPYALRVGGIALANLLFIRTTSLAQMVAALKALRLPETAVLFIGCLLRFLPRIFREAQRVVEAQRCRGLAARRLFTPSGVLSVFVPLFISQLQHARDLAISLEIRTPVPAPGTAQETGARHP
jgi:energy-coupling factor transport system permease protein